MFVVNDTQELRKKIDDSVQILKSSKSIAEKIAVSNYIENINDAITCVEEVDLELSEETIYGSLKDRRKYFKKLNIYQKQLLENFILNKMFHNSFMGEVLSGVEENFLDVEEKDLSPTTNLSEEDYHDIFYQFMKSINLENLFDKYVKEKKIYSTSLEYSPSNLGFTIYNPVKRDSDIFIFEFEYNIHSMFTLAHEFGHVYDLSHYDEDILKFNNSSYRSFFGETISKTFERLFLDYMISNNILIDESLDKLFEMNLINHDYVLAAYMLSLLPDKYIENEAYTKLRKGKFIKLIKNEFISEEAVREFVFNSVGFNINEDFTYAYGDILSMFIKNEIDENGFSNDLLKEFFSKRCEVFSEEFFREWGMGPENYVKLHDKQMQYLKK